jgi:benzoate/toluate 1,2-dioxygenase beta subunit
MIERQFRVEQFLFREAALLDERRFDEWLALFEPDGWYWAPVLGDATERGLALAHIDEDRPQLEIRIRRLGKPNAWSEQPPTRSCRIVSNVIVDAQDDGGEWQVRSRLYMREFRLRVGASPAEQSHVARVTHLLRPAHEGFRIAGKRVDLVDAEGALAAGSVPF